MTPVLILAAGAGWETSVLGVLERAAGLVVLRRCVDVDDLLAAATSGQAEAAVVALDVPGLDARVVDQLHHAGVRVVGVLPRGAAQESARVAASRAGIGRVVGEDDLAAVPATITAPEASAAPRASAGAPTHVRDCDPVAEGRVIAVWGPAGAPGRSTVAAGLAAEIARRRRAVLLIDADPYGGSIAQQLGVLDEVSGLLAASRSGLGPSARLIGTHLAVLTGLPRPDRWAELRAGVIGDILEQGAQVGEVVVDTGFSLEDSADPTLRAGRNQLTLETLDAADELVVVGAADPVGLSRLARGLVDLRDRVPSTPVRVVVNRMRSSLGWSEQELAAMVTGLVRPLGIHFLPDDRPAVDRALVEGRTLAETAPDSPFGRAIAALVDELVPSLAPATPRRVGRARRR